MQLTQRPFRDDSDKAQMLALVALQPEDYLHVVDLPYRLSSWAFNEPENVALWETADGKLLGWSVLQSPFWAIDIAAHPDAPPSLYGEMLAWADQRACAIIGTDYGRPAWFIGVLERQHELRTMLEAQGFADQSAAGEDAWSKYLFRRGAQQSTCHALPKGIDLRPLNGAAEVPAYVALHRAVFDSTSMTESWRARTLTHPGYRPELDLVAVDQQGNLAGFCICWFTPHGPGRLPSGQIEPLGVRADLRNAGVARALMAEGVKRMIGMGAQQIFVETDNYRGAAFNLYTSAGFVIAEHVLVYRKDVGG
jgi:mycothiol synthase